MMKAFITGVGGFVGGYLARELLSNNYEVHGIDINKNKIKEIEFFKANILDKKEIFNILRRVKPDIVFHLAAQSSVKRGWKEPELTFDINVNGTKNLLDSVNKKTKVLVISSADVYGIPKEIPIEENAELNPISPYGRSRLEQEKLAMDYIKEGFQIIISRSFSHTGPGQLPFFVCSELAKQIAEVEKGLRKEVLTGNLNIKRDFSDVRDIVKAYVLAIKKGAIGEIYNICSGRGFTIKEILDALIRISNIHVNAKEDKNKIRKDDIPLLVGDNTKFCKATGWKPRIAFKQTLKDLLDYWRDNT